MKCTQCGAENDAAAQTCSQCGGELAAAPAPPPSPVAPQLPSPPAAPQKTVPNYLVQAILVTVCCCVPFGIPAIVYAARVNGKLEAGDPAGAQEASAKARMWCWIAFGCGALGSVLYLVLILAGMVTG